MTSVPTTSRVLPPASPLSRLAESLELRMAALAICIASGLAIASPHFLTVANLLNLADQATGVGVVAIGMTVVVLTGGIDLSVGSIVGVAGVVFGLTVQNHAISVAVLAALATGALAGIVTGLLVGRLGIASFVVTLGGMAIGRSLSFIFSGANTITNIPPELGDAVYASVLGIRLNVLLMIVLYAVAFIYLNYTNGGRTIYAIGSNVEAARAAGLRVRFYSVLPYVLSGTLSAVAAVMMTGQTLTVDPLGGTGLELDTIATVVIGGASLYGGRGSVVGTLIGVCIMVMIRNGLNLVGISPFWQGSAIGTIIVAAVVIERLAGGRGR